MRSQSYFWLFIVPVFTFLTFLPISYCHSEPELSEGEESSEFPPKVDQPPSEDPSSQPKAVPQDDNKKGFQEESSDDVRHSSESWNPVLKMDPRVKPEDDQRVPIKPEDDNKGRSQTGQSQINLSPEDKVYLTQIMRETWDSISSLVYPDTGVPFDNTARQNYTSMSNIGFYLACVFSAERLGFIKRENAVNRVSKCLDFLEKLEKWHGFPASWVQVYHPFSTERLISPVDSAHAESGLILSRVAYPELEPQITKLVDAMDWTAFYDAKHQTLKGGFSLKENKELDFRYSYLGTDLRMAYFLAVAKGSSPVEFWKSLHRIVEERYGIRYLAPGWRAGGMFLQLMMGIYLNERHNLMGKSAANLAYAQIIHAWKKQYPVWGWSPSASPDGGYLGENKIIDEIVSPHASILAVSYYPRQVINNLKALEKFRLRKPFYTNDGPANFGFRDAVNIKTGKMTEKFLIIDQEMIFLSLVNFLYDGLIWKTFSRDPIVQKGISLMKEYQIKDDPELETLYQKRDLFGAQDEVIDLDLGLENAVVKPFVEPVLMKTGVRHAAGEFVLDGNLSEWEGIEPLTFPMNRTLELGVIMSPADLDAKAYFQWDDDFLYFAIEVIDDHVFNDEEAKKIFKDDCVELFIDPQNDGLKWGDSNEYQIGFAPTSLTGKPVNYAWFQNREPKKKEVDYTVQPFKEEGKEGYRIEAAISWSYLNIKPKAGLIIGASPAVHDADPEKSFDAKINWCYVPPKPMLGELTLSPSHPEEL